MKIAAIYTCYNRKEKTLSSLRSLFKAVDHYNRTHCGELSVEVFLTDDGCTDGTSAAIINEFPDKIVNILKGDGNLFWAGGMRLAWKEAMKRHAEWDYYLLLNDDTDLFEICIEELLATHQFCLDLYNKLGIYSGTTCAKSDRSKQTYGGDVYESKFWGHPKKLYSNGTPQMVDITNANILMVPKFVVENIGIFYEGYVHGVADSDYAMMCRRAEIPVLITANNCGACDNDHSTSKEILDKVKAMSLKERKAYYKHPLHSNKDYLTFIRRNIPLKYPMTYMFRQMNVYCPCIYEIMDKLR